MAVKLVVGILSILLFLAYNIHAVEIYDLRKYGASRDADISRVLSDVWEKACESKKPSRIVIPKGKWHLSQVRLQGPNKAPLELQVQGTIQAPSDPNQVQNKTSQWITINYVDKFVLSGGGMFDGKGQKAWKMNDCHKNRNCPTLPINLSFNFISNAIISGVTSKDSKSAHVNCISSHNVTFTHFNISAPGGSPNTDGIHLGRSSDIKIIDSFIGTGDDCVSMGDDTREVHIRNVTCGPGHGISVGSLGGAAAEKDVKGIYVQNCTFIGTENGVRVKTWPSTPARMRVSDLHFEDLIMKNVGTPVAIDQEYCPHGLCKLEKPSLIQLRNITIKNIKGTTNGTAPVSLVCSKVKPCKNVVLGDVNLKFVGSDGPAAPKCVNVKPSFVGKQNPQIKCGGESRTDVDYLEDYLME